MEELKFYRCDHCGNIITKVHDGGVDVVCCGEPMKELVAGSTDGAAEKHVPQYEVKDGIVTVNVGSVDHPMEDKHYIEWVALETNQGTQIKYLEPGEKPHVEFALAPGEDVVNVYEYCNIHGLWKK
ncbi:MAG: desulfoferrodoxin FeS4 iron-binding domain-containing protein [Clostridia bacterium]|nr:desulfoferrodoxin FeS4 iron-binding domain-containing protein [Clostridia bacterium]